MYIVDRRLNNKGKSLENRQRFLRRAKTLVQGAVKNSSKTRGVKNIAEGGEISIAPGGLKEPMFRRKGGIHDMILPGNKKYIEGDIIPRDDAGGGNDAGEGDSTDEFRFILSRDEFIDVFLDDLELPDLTKRKLKDDNYEGVQRAGYSTTGSQANIAIGRTVRLGLARRIALGRPKPEEIAKLEAEIAACSDEEVIIALNIKLEKLKAKFKRIPFLDPIDIRFRRFEPTPKPISQAVMFCIMDVSGSVSEEMKDLSKRFYMLLYIFLTRRYQHVEVIFIRHTDKAEEVDEETFFYEPVSGGTLVSSALKLMKEIIKDRYRLSDWNIYCAQTSDGDNALGDILDVETLLTDSILPVCQFYAYVEVGEENSSGQKINTIWGSFDAAMPDSSLWILYKKLVEEGKHLAIRKVNNRADIFPVFHDFFEKKTQHAALI